MYAFMMLSIVEFLLRIFDLEQSGIGRSDYHQLAARCGTSPECPSPSLLASLLILMMFAPCMLASCKDAEPSDRGLVMTSKAGLYGSNSPANGDATWRASRPSPGEEGLGDEWREKPPGDIKDGEDRSRVSEALANSMADSSSCL